MVPVLALEDLIASRHSSRACAGWERCERPWPAVDMQWTSPKRVSVPLTPGAAWICTTAPQGQCPVPPQCPPLPSAPGRRGWGEWIFPAPSVPFLTADSPSPFLDLLHPCTVFPHEMLGCTVSKVWWVLGGCCFIRSQRIVHRGLIHLGGGIEAAFEAHTVQRSPWAAGLKKGRA